MRIETPDPSLYDAAVLMGQTGAERPSMAVVLKASYDLMPDAAGPWRMQPRQGAKVVMQDQGQLRFTAEDAAPPILNRAVSPGDFVVRAGPPEQQVLSLDGQDFTLDSISADDGADDQKRLNFDLTYEADIALSKAGADIVVLGLGGGDGRVRVNGLTWLTRNPALPGAIDADFNRNLFGFQPRLREPRKSAASAPASFASYHRRGGQFSDQGTQPALPSGVVVEIYRHLREGAQPDFALRLPDLRRVLRLRVYCGHGADRPPQWSKVTLGEMRPDTLIIDPLARRADLLWRLAWDSGIERIDSYRSLQIAEGGF